MKKIFILTAIALNLCTTSLLIASQQLDADAKSAADSASAQHAGTQAPKNPCNAKLMEFMTRLGNIGKNEDCGLLEKAPYVKARLNGEIERVKNNPAAEFQKFCESVELTVHHHRSMARMAQIIQNNQKDYQYLIKNLKEVQTVLNTQLETLSTKAGSLSPQEIISKWKTSSATLSASLIDTLSVPTSLKDMATALNELCTKEADDILKHIAKKLNEENAATATTSHLAHATATAAAASLPDTATTVKK